MRNPDLPKLLRAIAVSDDAKKARTAIIYVEAAIELDKLNKLYDLLLSNKDITRLDVIKILNEAP